MYWADYDSGAVGGVYRTPKDGLAGAREQLAGPQPFARDIAVDDRFAYVALATASSGPPGAIVRVPKAGGALEVFAAAQWNPDHVVAHHGSVQWNANPPGVVLSAPAAGGAPVVLVNGEVFLMTLRGADLFWADRHGNIRQVPAAGGSVKDVGTVGSVPSDMVVDDRFVYVADVGRPEMPPARACPKNTPCPIATTAPTYRHGEIIRISIASGDRKTLARELGRLTRLAVDGDRVYFVSQEGLQAIAKDGSGTVRTLGPDSSITSRMLVDGDRLIFESDQHIVSVARPAP